MRFLGEMISGPAAFVIMLAFFLPWVTVSCGSVEETYTGYDMTVGLSEDGATTDDVSEEETDGDIILAFIPLGAVGILVTIGQRLAKALSNPDSRANPMVFNAGFSYFAFGVIGLGLHGMKYLAIQDDLETARQQAGSMVDITYEIGWYLSIFGLLAMILAGIVTVMVRSALEAQALPTMNPNIHNPSP